MHAVQDTLVFCETLVKETGVMPAPCRMFHYGDRHVRFGFGRDSLPAGIDRLSAYLRTNRPG